MSTTALAKHFDIPSQSLFNFLTEKSWIEKIDKNWRLTGKGEFEGGEYIQSQKFGEYIGWPKSIIEHAIFQELLEIPLNVEALGKRFDIGSHRF
ncbi:MAG TPA: 4-alpha-glucanotransferase, partial [Cellvibrionales bacterium]|nr:4-alpha-glucanotransferase [Cellvibrionales bacterium]